MGARPVPAPRSGTGSAAPDGVAATAARPRQRPTLADVRPSRTLGRALLVMLGATTAITALATAMLLARGGTIGLIVRVMRGDLAALENALAINGIAIVLTVVTAIVWFAWFDRVLTNVPALTGTWPDTGRFSAVGWWLVPIAGFVKAPRIVGDVYNRLAVNGTPGLWLLALWALAMIGGTVVPFFASRVLLFVPLPLDVTLGLTDLVTVLGQIVWIAAGILAVAMVLAIEHASDTRLRGGGADVPPPSGSSAEFRLAAAIRAAAETNAAVRAAQHGVATPANAAASRPTPAAPPSSRGDMPVLAPVARPPAPGTLVTERVVPGGIVRMAGPAPAVAMADPVTPEADIAADGPPPGADPAQATTPGSLPAPGAAASAGTPEAADRPAPVEGVERRRAAVPGPIIGVLTMSVVAAIAAGTMVAAPPEQRRDPFAVAAAGLGTAEPRPTLPRPAAEPTTSVRTPAAATPAPTSPAWIAARERLAAGTFAEDWVGRMELDGALKVGERPAVTWSLSVARAGTTERTKERIDDPAAPAIQRETVILARTVWTRSAGSGWSRRERSFGDQPTEALFGIQDADGLAWVRSFREDGRLLHEFDAPGASDLLVLAFLRDVGTGSLDRTAATVVADSDGTPVRAALTYAGTTRSGRARLEVTVAWSDVGGDITITSPKEDDAAAD